MRILASMVLAFAAAACNRQPAMDASQIPHTPIPKAEARLTLANNNGKLRYEGVVADEATRSALLRSVRSVYGPDATGGLSLEPNTNPPPWAARLGELLLAFRMPGGVLTLEGRRIELAGAVGDEDRAMLLKKAERLYPGYEYAGLLQGVDMRYALPEPGDTDGLIAFLNAIPILFEPDSGMLASSSLDGASRAARAIKGAGKGVRLQIGVHPERSDMPEYDRDIAFQRANAIKVQLSIRGIDPGILDAKVLPGGSADQAGKAEFALAPAAPATPADEGKSTPEAKQEAGASQARDTDAAPPGR